MTGIRHRGWEGGVTAISDVFLINDFSREPERIKIEKLET